MVPVVDILPTVVEVLMTGVESDLLAVPGGTVVEVVVVTVIEWVLLVMVEVGILEVGSAITAKASFLNSSRLRHRRRVRDSLGSKSLLHARRSALHGLGTAGK